LIRLTERALVLTGNYVVTGNYVAGPRVSTM